MKIRCDYLDPALAWTGVKNSGRGVSLSKFGMFPVPFDFISPSSLVRLRSAHESEICSYEDQDRINDGGFGM